MWSIRIAIGGAVFAAALASATAQTARTASPAAPLSLLEVNQGPIVDPSPVVTDKTVPQAKAKTQARTAHPTTPSRPAPIGTAAVSRATVASPAARADAQTPTRGVSLPSRTAPPSAKLVAKTVPARGASSGAVDWSQAKALGFAGEAQKEPPRLAAPTEAPWPDQPVAVMVPAPATQPSVPTMVAEPGPLGASPQGADSSSLVQILGTLSGGAVGGAIVWYLAGAGLKRSRAREFEEEEQPRGYNWASSYDNRRDNSSAQEEAIGRPRGYHPAPAHDVSWNDSREWEQTGPPWHHQRTAADDDRWNNSPEWEQAGRHN